jgi:hypothetical protein
MSAAATPAATYNGGPATVAPAGPATYIPANPPAAPVAPKHAARDVADLLPPVDYPSPRQSQKAQEPQDQAGPWGPQGPKPAPPAPRSPARPNTTAGLALMVAAAALTLVLPVAGLLASLAVITLLRAADLAQSKLAVRRSVRGPRASDLVLVAPLAIIVGAAAYGLAVVFTHSMNMPRAGAYAAAAVVAWYGLGPGSGRPRRQLDRMAGAVARSRTSAAGIALAVWALAVAAVLFASSQTPYYWPAAALHIPGHIPWHLPSLQSLITSASHWLIRSVYGG